MREIFKNFSKSLFSLLEEDESISLFLSAEQTFFLRINTSKIRQIMRVNQGNVTLTFIKNQRSTKITFPFGTSEEKNCEAGAAAIRQGREECHQLLIDPFCIALDNAEDSFEEHTGNFPKNEAWVDTLLPHLKNFDCAGFLTAGSIMRASANSLGQHHWYQSESFFLDCSFYTPLQQSVKFFYGDKDWSEAVFQKKLHQVKNQLSRLEKPKKNVPPGKYRTYFAPEAVSDLIRSFSVSVGSFGNGVSARAYHQGQSALKLIADGKAHFSPLFHLTEDYTYGFSPRFNNLGELAPLSLPIIAAGQLKNFLVSTKTAKEYHLQSNYAEPSEYLKSAVVTPGNLKETEILKALGTGLYVSNVHYLNWSDMNKGRITGMTRYACFWVENGEIIAPIQDLRFDESIYHIFGDGLMGLTESTSSILETSTYDERAIGGKRVPGILVDNFTYTL